MQFNNEYEESSYLSPEKKAEICLKELTEKNITSLVTFDSVTKNNHVTTIFYDKRECIIRTAGAYRDGTANEEHLEMLKAICYSFALNTLRLTLIDGGNGSMVPLIVDMRDPSVEKLKIV